MTNINNLSLYRKKKKYSMDDLAKIAGLSQSTISLIENGKRYPALRTARKLAEALNTSVDNLFPNNSQKAV